MKTTHTAIVTGADGQDASYLIESLMASGLNVVGTVRGTGNPYKWPQGVEEFDGNTKRYKKIFNFDFQSQNETRKFMRDIRPSRFFHLAAHHGPSSLAKTYNQAESELTKVHATFTENILTSIAELNLDTKFIVAGSSKMFTPGQEDLLVNEGTEGSPSDAYGASKQKARDLVYKFRDRHGINCQMAILFNHDSPRRSFGYVTWDIAKQLQLLLKGDLSVITLQNGLHRGDWFDARDAVQGLLAMSNKNEPMDYVLASGQIRSVSEMVNGACLELGLEVPDVVSIAPHANRAVFGDFSQAVENLDWQPKREIEQTIVEMVQTKLPHNY